MTQALLLIDIQNDYFPGGAMELEGSPLAGRKAGELLQAFRRASKPVVHVQHVSTRPGATFFLPDTKGVEIHESVAPLQGETVIRKHHPNSFRDTPLLEHLRGHGVAELVIAGMMTQMCVDSSTRAARPWMGAESYETGVRCDGVAPSGSLSADQTEYSNVPEGPDRRNVRASGSTSMRAALRRTWMLAGCQRANIGASDRAMP